MTHHFSRLSLWALALALSFLGSQATASGSASRWAQLESLWVARDGAGLSAGLAALPKNDPLRPVALAWSLMSDPLTPPGALAQLGKKIPESLLRDQLYEDAGLRLARSGLFSEALSAFAQVGIGRLSTGASCARHVAQLNIGSASALPAVSRDQLFEWAAGSSGSKFCAQALWSAHPSEDLLGALILSAQGSSRASLIAQLDAQAPPEARAGLSRASRLIETGLARIKKGELPALPSHLPLSSAALESERLYRELLAERCSSASRAPLSELSAVGLSSAARCAIWRRDWREFDRATALFSAHPSLASRGVFWTSLARWEAPSSGLGFHYQGRLAEMLWGSPLPAVLPEGSSACPSRSRELVLLLWRAGARQEALTQWRYLLRHSSDAERLCMGELALSKRIWPLASHAFGALRSPHARGFMPFEVDSLRKASSTSKLPFALLAAVARQETRFDTQARSRAGALGLFQLMPATALDEARKAKLHPPSESQLLTDVALNAKLGAQHLASHERRFGGRTAWSLCAYNAGSGRCSRWERALHGLPLPLQIEAFPLEEPRGYAERILFAWDQMDPGSGALTSMLSDLKEASRLLGRHRAVSAGLSKEALSESSSGSHP